MEPDGDVLVFVMCQEEVTNLVIGGRNSGWMIRANFGGQAEGKTA